MENTSDVWQYPMRKHCITSIYILFALSFYDNIFSIYIESKYWFYEHNFENNIQLCRISALANLTI